MVHVVHSARSDHGCDMYRFVKDDLFKFSTVGRVSTVFTAKRVNTCLQCPSYCLSGWFDRFIFVVELLLREQVWFRGYLKRTRLDKVVFLNKRIFVLSVFVIVCERSPCCAYVLQGTDKDA